MSRSQQLAVGFLLVSASLQTVAFARGFAGVSAQDRLGIPSRGFLGFPAGGVGGFAGGHMRGLHAVGMPGRNEFDTLLPVTLPNLRADGRLHPYGMPPMGARGDFHPGGLPGMGGYGGLHPVNMPDVFETSSLRMGGTITGDGGSARLAADPVPPGGFATGRLRTDPPVAPAGMNVDALQAFVLQPDEFESQTEAFKTLSAVNRFAGLPTDAGMHAVGGARTGHGITSGETLTVETRAPNPARAAVAGQDAAASQDVNAAPSGTAGGGQLAKTSHSAMGSHGTLGIWLAATGGRNVSSTYDHAASSGVDRWFVDHAVFTPAWCDTHAWAWCPAAYEVADWTRMAWTVATWDEAAQWLAWESPPVHSGNGINFYRRNSARPVANAAKSYDYEQAHTLANSNSNAQESQDDQWLPLGVFALMTSGQQEPAMIIQLAINQQGVIRGNSYDQASDSNLPVRGVVDKSSQRAVWTVGNNNQVVIESELSNLTRDDAQALVHFGADKTVQYLMIRERPQQDLAESSNEGRDQ